VAVGAARTCAQPPRDVRGISLGAMSTSAAPAPAAVQQQLADRVFASLDAGGVSWCRLRDSDSTATYDDIDLLVDASHLGRVCGILAGHGFVPLPSLGRASHRFFLALDEQTATWVELDIVTELAYGAAFALKTGLAAGCLARADRGRLTRDDAFWTLFLHCAADKRAFAPRHTDQLRRLAPDADDAGSTASTVAALADTAGFSAAVVSAVRTRDEDALRRLGAMLEKRWSRARRQEVSAARALAPFARAAEKVLVAHRRRGVRVAVLGVDGAGKSTLIDDLLHGFPFPARAVYMGFWNEASLFARLPAGDSLRAILRPAIVWVRYLTGLAHRHLGRLVLFDRYTYDAMLPPRPPYVRLKSVYFRFLARLLPAPDLVLVLDANVAVAATRKPTPDRRGLEQDRLALLALGERLPNAVVLDTARERGAAARDAQGLIWRIYRRRWKGG